MSDSGYGSVAYSCTHCLEISVSKNGVVFFVVSANSNFPGASQESQFREETSSC
jgi:hypothetical protein